MVLSAEILLSFTARELSDTDFITQSPLQEHLTSRVKFYFNDNLRILDNQGTGTSFVTPGETVIGDAWFELKIMYRFLILYFINNNLTYTGTVFGGTNVEQYIVLFENFESDVFFDSIVYSDGTLLSVDEFYSNTFSHFYNKNSDILTLESSAIALENIQIFNLLGQEAMNRPLN